MQHYAALGKAVDTLDEAQALAGFMPFAKLATEYSDFDAFHNRGEHALSKEWSIIVRCMRPWSLKA